MATLPELTAVLCIAAIIIIIIVFLLLWFVFKFIIAFFPSIVVAIIAYLLTGNWVVAAVAFILSAILFAVVGSKRKRQTYYR